MGDVVPCVALIFLSPETPLRDGSASRVVTPVLAGCSRWCWPGVERVQASCSRCCFPDDVSGAGLVLTGVLIWRSWWCWSGINGGSGVWCRRVFDSVYYCKFNKNSPSRNVLKRILTALLYL